MKVDYSFTACLIPSFKIDGDYWDKKTRMMSDFMFKNELSKAQAYRRFNEVKDDFVTLKRGRATFIRLKQPDERQHSDKAKNFYWEENDIVKLQCLIQAIDESNNLFDYMGRAKEIYLNRNRISGLQNKIAELENEIEKLRRDINEYEF